MKLISELNTFEAEVINIYNKDEINVVKFNLKTTTILMMSLELPANIKLGTRVSLGVKPSHVSLTKDENILISHSNKLLSKITNIIEGEVLCIVEVSFEDYKIESLLTKQDFLKMNLKKGENILVLINSSELYIKEVFDV